MLPPSSHTTVRTIPYTAVHEGIFEELDGWLRRKLRRILWKQLEAPQDASKETDAAGIIQRGDDSINVAATVGHFLYAAEFLKHLSLTEGWMEPPGQGNRG